MDKKGFSLLELSICLMAVCLMVICFNPFLSKKLQGTSLVIGDSGLSEACDTLSSCCSLCYPKKCVVCDSECASCAANQFLNKNACKCYSCSDTDNGGIAGCHKCHWDMADMEVICDD